MFPTIINRKASEDRRPASLYWPSYSAPRPPPKSKHKTGTPHAPRRPPISSPRSASHGIAVLPVERVRVQPALQLSGDALPVPAEDAGAGVGVAAQQAGPRGPGHARPSAGFRQGVGRDAAVPQERGAHERVRVVPRAERADAGGVGWGGVAGLWLGRLGGNVGQWCSHHVPCFVVVEEWHSPLRFFCLCWRRLAKA